MCEYYVKADPIQYEQRSRTIRIRGVLTTIRLENSFWDILAEMAEQEGCTTNSLITMFHDEIIAERGEIPNFASFLRVTCIRYLRRTVIEQEKKLEAALGYSSVDNAASEFAVSLPCTGTDDVRPTGNIRAFSR